MYPYNTQIAMFSRQLYSVLQLGQYDYTFLHVPKLRHAECQDTKKKRGAAMSSSISEKLDFLMKVTGTRNASLGRTLNYDASYISRIRNGKRGIPPEQPFIKPASEFFAGLSLDDYQKSVLSHELGIGRPWPESSSEAAALLEAWLNNDLGSKQRAKDIITAISSPFYTLSAEKHDYVPEEGSNSKVTFYYGNHGKRDAVCRFLNELVKSGKAFDLYLNSNEDMSWLYEDAAFARTWARHMVQLSSNGCRIKIIHSIGRDINEMWEGLRKWIPLYMSGTIEPYYYPRLRDGIFRKTFFLAAGHSGIISSSIAGQDGDALNIFIEDRIAVRALEKEFLAFLALCRPLMQIVKPDEKTELLTLLDSFEELPGEFSAIKSAESIICIKESGAMILKTRLPLAAFVIKEPRMVAALEEYMLGPYDASSPPGLTADEVRTLLSD